LKESDKQKVSQAERHAVYTAHSEKCYICGAILTMQTVQIDHVVPEALANDADAFEQARNQLGLPPSFEINSYENWLPACSTCNLDKLDRVWDPSLQVQAALQRASDRAPKARELERKLTTDRKVANAVSTIVAASESDQLTPELIEKITPLIEFQAEHRAKELAEEPIRLTPAIQVDRYRFNTRANIAIVPGSEEKIDVGSEFFIQGRRLTEFMVKFSFKPLSLKRGQFIHMDVYIDPPKIGETPGGLLPDGTSLVILSYHKTVRAEVGGYQVTLQSWQQAAKELWIVLSTS